MATSVPPGTPTLRPTSAWSAAGRNPSVVSDRTSATSTPRRSSEKRRASSLASSSRSPTSRSSRRASVPMTEAAWAGSAARPSLSASAKPRIDVRGVRRSWDTDSRNCRSSPLDRSRPAARAFIDRARRARSSPPSSGSGTRTARSPAAMRRAASSAARRGRVRRRPSLVATPAATARVPRRAARNQGPGAARPAPTWRVTTTARTGPASPRRAGAAAKAREPRTPVTVRSVISRSGSRSAALSPDGTAPRTRPSGPMRTTAWPSRRRARATAPKAPGASRASTSPASLSAWRPRSRRAWAPASRRKTSSVPRLATSNAPATMATMVRVIRRVMAADPSSVSPVRGWAESSQPVPDAPHGGQGEAGAQLLA